MSFLKLSKENETSIPGSILITFSLLTIGILLTGYFSYISQRNKIIKEYQENITAIGTLKTRQIETWRNERLGDAELVRNNGPLVKSIKTYLSVNNKAGIERDLQKWMESLNAIYDYDGVFILDTLSEIRLAVTKSDSGMTDGIREESGLVLKDLKVRMTDLYRNNNQGQPKIDILVPLISNEGTGGSAFGIILFRIDPAKILFPLLKSWPTTSKSSETLLVRKEGDSVLFLNELRFKTNTALRLTLPGSSETLPAAIAARGVTGLVEGLDYRNKSVVAYLTDVSGTTWHMVTKVDKEEFLKPLRQYLLIEVFVIVLLILINASLSLFWIWNQRVNSYKAAEKLKKSEELYSKLFQNMLNGFAYCRMLYKEGLPSDFIYLSVNKAFETQTGLRNVEGKKASEAIPGIQKSDPELLARYGRVASTGIPEFFEIYVESLEMWFSISVYCPEKEYFVAVFDVVTERKKGEEALLKSKALLLAVIDATPFPVALVDIEDNKIEIWSHSAMTLFGHTASTSSEWYELAYPDPDYRQEVIQRWKPFLEVAKKSGKTVNTGEYKVSCLDGSVLYCELFATFLEEKLIVTFNNITERKTAEKALAESEERFRSMYENIAIGIYRTTIDGEILLANPAMVRMMGFASFEQLADRNLEMEGYEADYPRSEFHKIMVEKGRIAGFESAWHKSDGSVLYVRESATAVRDQNGKILYYDGTVEDITSRKQIEKALENERNLLRTLIDLLPSIIFVKDMESRFLLANTACAAFMGAASPNDLIGKTDFEFYGNELSNQFRSDEAEVLKGNLIINKEEGNHSPGGTPRDLLTTKVPLRGSNGEIIGLVGTCFDITDRKEAVESLRKSQKKFRDTIMNLDEGYYSVTTDGILIDHNQAFNHILGFDKSQDMRGSHLPDFWLVPEDRLPYLRELTLNGSVVNYLINAKKRSGERIKVIASAHLVKEEDNNEMRIEGVFLDITKLKRAEEDLRLKNLVFDASIAANSISDINGRITEVNDAFLKVWGYKEKKDVIGLPIPEFIQKESEAVEIVKALESMGQWEGNYTGKRKDGTNFIAHGLATIVKDEEGKIIGYQSAVIDVTESITLSRQIEEERNKLASLLNSIPDEVWYADSEKKFTLTNPSALKEFGLDSTDNVEIEKFAGSLEVFLPDGAPRPIEMAPPLRALAGEIVKNSEELVRIPGKNELHHRQVSAAPVRDSSGKIIGAISVARDITDLKAAEFEVRKLNEELEQRVVRRTEQLEAANKELEAFSYSVSHDLRAPLRAVHSFTNILLEDYEKVLDDEGKRICGIISSSATQMGELIDDLLSFSRIGRSTMNPAKLDMKNIANSLFDELSIEYGKNRIRFKIGRLHKVYGDPGLIKLVWNNLISNALKYSSKKPVPVIEISSTQEENRVTYFVKDNGVGFNMQYRQKLFGVFQRLHSESEFEGNGVGLAIVQRIINKHGGQIWAEGEEDKGATFYFSLPAEGKRQQASGDRKTKYLLPDA
jgi:PAS domain S-box-containing protein